MAMAHFCTGSALISIWTILWGNTSVQSSATDWTVRGLNLAGVKVFLSSRTIQTIPGAHPASHLMGNAGFPGVKQPWPAFDRSSTSSFNVKNEWS